MCVHYLVYKLLHPLHGVVSLQQSRHSHEAFVAAPIKGNNEDAQQRSAFSGLAVE